MPVPASYTESGLADYMHSVLGSGNVAGSLGYQSPGSYAEAVVEALLSYGQDNIALITGSAAIKKLRALARIEAWRQAVAHLASDFNFSVDGGQYSRAQVFEHAKLMLQAEELRGLEYDPRYRIGVDRITHTEDPYSPMPLEDAL